MSPSTSSDDVRSAEPSVEPMDGYLAYKLLANELRERIFRGEFPPSRRLPTETELVAQRPLSRHTVRRAYRELEAESLVRRVRGQGTFATETPSRARYLRSVGSVEDLLALSLDTVLEVVAPLETQADVTAAGRLHLPSDDVMVTTFRRLHGNVVFSVTTTWVPPDIGVTIASVEFLREAGRRSSETIIDLIERRSSVWIAGAHQSITAVALPSSLAPLLECQPLEPVLRIDRLYFDQHGNYVELSVSHFNPLRYSYRLELRRNERPL